MTMRTVSPILPLIILFFAIPFFPADHAKAQAGCVDPTTGLPISCTPEPENNQPTKTSLPPAVLPSSTLTPTSTATLTFTPSPTSTFTSTFTVTWTSTSSITPASTFTPRFSDPATNWMPGIGIGALILLLIIGLLLPAIQKIRVANRS
ncbi:MAG: hypothetical protein K8S20_17640 [Chloroflexi bacterium]|nr:hypothetical protein [Chloroflexota bacterium]